jgi:TolA-binding protein
MPDGDRILFGEAVDAEWEASRRGGRRGADRDAFRLYFQIAEFFPSSPLAGEALYRAADIQWQLDAADVRTRPSAKKRDPRLHAKMDEELIRRVMKKFPGTKWADLAAFHLIENKLCGDWEGQPKCPERESEMYEEYAREHPQSPKASEALYNAAWRQAALIQIYKGQNNSGDAEKAKQRAASLAQRIVSQYAQTDWAARARRLAFLVEQNVPTYGNVEE